MAYGCAGYESGNHLVGMDHHAWVAPEVVLLNQIGIVMNVLAWLLLGPELIGHERLARFEGWLERNLNGATGVLPAFRASLLKNWLSLIGCAISVAFALAIALWMIFGAIPREIVQTGQNFPLVPIGFTVVLIVVLWVVSHLAQFVAGKLARSLEGGNRLTSYMVPAGVVLFLTGNALQFVATLLPPSGS